ncbi:MAG TPA: metal-dependent hydrolase [Aeromonadales bacterium]|nr:metal-dependent hydrolase [Aeromonadales bacterium]
MIIGHLPAGYIVSKLIVKKLTHKINAKLFILWGVLGGIAPDFDMIYFYLIDHRQYHHHTYWSHLPVVWICMIIIGFIWYRWVENKEKAILMLVFSVCGFIHLILDSIVGDIWWLAPWVNKPFSLFTVPAIYEPWWLNFILHWSFYLELLIVLWAVVLWFRSDDSKSRKG